MTSSSLQSRRDFLGTTSAVLAGALMPHIASGANAPSKNPLPRWRGFNLVNFFQAFSRGEEGQGILKEDDLRWIRDWGFDFIRLPMDYWFWIDSDWKTTRKLTPDDVMKISEAALEKVDKAIALCQKYGLHTNFNFHRAPGYCINNPEREPYVLWSDPRAEDAFVYHWDLFAKRYRGIPEKDLSFNLVNEAPTPRKGYMTREDYRRVMTRATEAIRKHSPKRTIIIDGLDVGNEVATEMIPTGVAQSVHAYWPGQISHFRASWVDKNNSLPEPSWPVRNSDGSIKMGRADLEKRFAPWGKLAREGIGVHCGEGGAFSRTPYPVFMAWMTDVLEILQSHQIGWALWNFRGPFGILNSGRTDIQYEDWHGQKLDRKLLDLLRAH